MISSGLVFYYWALFLSFFTSDVPILGKFFVGLLMLITVSVFIFFIIYFRFLFIRNNKIFSIYPFRLKYNIIEINKIKKVSWDSIVISAKLYKKVSISTSDGKSTYLSDLEFENLDSLIADIPNINSVKVEELNKYQAKNHDPKFTLICLIVFNLIIIYLNFFAYIYHWIHLVFYFVSFLLIIATVRRIRKYNNINKKYL